MKKIIVLFIVSLSILTFDGFCQLKVNSSGYVGINQSSPAYNLDTQGSIRFSSSGTGDFIFDNSGYGGYATLHPETDCGGNLGSYGYRFNKVQADHVIATYVDENSDARLKENVTDLENVMEKVKKLHGVRYDLKPDFYNTKDAVLKSILANKGKNQIGFLAQELKEVFPEVVSLDSSSNLYSVSYTRMVPVLVEAIKEQQQMIEDLQSQIENCCNMEQNNLKSASFSEETTEVATLEQNIPNPFSNETIINCYIPESSLSATIYIFDLQGTQKRQQTINGKGNQSIKISGNSLIPGMYLYSLVVDNKEIDTKRMILTK